MQKPAVSDNKNIAPKPEEAEDFTFDIDSVDLGTVGDGSICGSLSVSTHANNPNRSTSLVNLFNASAPLPIQQGAAAGDGWAVHSSSPPKAQSPKYSQQHPPGHSLAQSAQPSSPILFSSSGRGSVMRSNHPNGVSQATSSGHHHQRSSPPTNGPSLQGDSHRRKAEIQTSRHNSGIHLHNNTPPSSQPSYPQQQPTMWPLAPPRVDDWGASGNSLTQHPEFASGVSSVNAVGHRSGSGVEFVYMSNNIHSGMSSANAVGYRSVSGTDFRITSISGGGGVPYNSGHEVQYTGMPQQAFNHSGAHSFGGNQIYDIPGGSGHSSSAVTNDGATHSFISNSGSQASERASARSDHPVGWEPPVGISQPNLYPQAMSVPQQPRPANPGGKVTIGKPRMRQQAGSSLVMGSPTTSVESPDQPILQLNPSSLRQGSSPDVPSPVYGQPFNVGNTRPPIYINAHQPPMSTPGGGIKIQVGTYAPIKFAPSITVGGKSAGIPPSVSSTPHPQ